MTTSRQAVEHALARIADVDRDLRAVCTVSDSALQWPTISTARQPRADLADRST
jgi:hypothetical protein